MNKTIFITGTTSGFGKAMVELFASNGWNVGATVRNKSEHSDLFKGLQNVKLFNLEASAISKPMSTNGTSLFQWIFSSNVEKLHTDVSQNLTK